MEFRKLIHKIKYKQTYNNQYKEYLISFYKIDCMTPISDGKIVVTLKEICEKYDATVTKYSLRDSDYLFPSVIKIRAEEKDINLIVSEFMEHIGSYIEYTNIEAYSKPKSDAQEKKYTIKFRKTKKKIKDGKVIKALVTICEKYNAKLLYCHMGQDCKSKIKLICDKAFINNIFNEFMEETMPDIQETDLLG